MDEIEAQFVEKDNIAIVAEYRNKCVGFIAGGPLERFLSFTEYDPHYGKEDSFYITVAAVDPKFQGRGVAKLMAEALSKQIKSEGYTRVSCHATSEPARRLCQKYGFKEIKFFDEFRGSRWASYMALDL